MSALTDALRIVLEPFKFLLDRVEKKVDNLPPQVQSDMAQSNPEAPDYIKNRIAYDNTNRKKIFEGILGGFRYGGEFFYSAEYDFVLKPNALYRIEVAHGGVIDSTVQRSVEVDGGYDIDVVIVLDIAQVYSVSTDPDDGKSTFACYHYDEIPRKVTIFEVEETEDVKTVPRHLMYNLPHAAADTLGAVMVSDNLENQIAPGMIWDSADITTDKYGKLHVRREVQTPWSVPDGHILAATNKAWKSADIKDILPTTVPQVQTASVGQTVVVKAVDESGKPTEWEAKDMSSGGAEGGPSDDIIIVRILVVDDEETETSMFVPNKSFDEVWEARQYDPSIQGRRMVVLEYLGICYHLVNYSSENDGLKSLFFVSGFRGISSTLGRYVTSGVTFDSVATHLEWRNDGKLFSIQFKVPAEYCMSEVYEDALNTPMPW